MFCWFFFRCIQPNSHCCLLIFSILIFDHRKYFYPFPQNFVCISLIIFEWFESHIANKTDFNLIRSFSFGNICFLYTRENINFKKYIYFNQVKFDICCHLPRVFRYIVNINNKNDNNYDRILYQPEKNESSRSYYFSDNEGNMIPFNQFKNGQLNNKKRKQWIT